MHTVQGFCTEVWGEKEHGGNAILTTNRKLMQAAHCSFIPPCQLYSTLEGQGQRGRLGKLRVVG